MHLHTFKSNGRQIWVLIRNPKTQFSISPQRHLGLNHPKAAVIYSSTIKTWQRRNTALDPDQKWDLILHRQLHTWHKRRPVPPRPYPLEASPRPRGFNYLVFSPPIQVNSDREWLFESSFGLIRFVFQILQESLEVKTSRATCPIRWNFWANDLAVRSRRAWCFRTVPVPYRSVSLQDGLKDTGQILWDRLWQRANNLDDKADRANEKSW